MPGLSRAFNRRDANLPGAFHNRPVDTLIASVLGWYATRRISRSLQSWMQGRRH